MNLIISYFIFIGSFFNFNTTISIVDKIENQNQLTAHFNTNENSTPTKTVQFSTKDDVKVTGDLYLTNDLSQPFILLCHQASFSRGEYIEIAPKLNALGYNCMAIDQRSGKSVNDIINQTKKSAVAKGLPTKYPNALPDIEAGVDYIVNQFKQNKVIIWGSSYSAALTMIVGNTYRDKISAILSFSPGEYFIYQDKKIEDYAKNINVPVFMTSSKAEAKVWETIFSNILSKNKTAFVPKAKGKHGSKALWSSHDGHQEYWDAVKLFLNGLKKS